MIGRLDQLDVLPRAGERLQELQLVVEVVLEPEDDLGARLERVPAEPVPPPRTRPAASARSPSRTR
jgi:hypothetical protein